MIAERPGDVSLRVDISIMRRGDGERKEIVERTDIMQSLTPKSRCPRTSCWYGQMVGHWSWIEGVPTIRQSHFPPTFQSFTNAKFITKSLAVLLSSRRS